MTRYPDKFITHEHPPPTPDPKIIVINIRAEYAEELEKLQELSYPTLNPAEHIRAKHYLRHLEVFPEGQFMALWGNKVVGSTSTFRTNMDFYNNVQHTYWETIGDGWLTTHERYGEWLYGADMVTHPEFRRRGISKLLYDARQSVVKRLNLRGQVAAGMVPGYYRYSTEMSPAQYMEKVAAGELSDPTMTAQLKNGFRYVAPVYNYLDDPYSGYASALIVRDNPDYIPPP
ncbi:MAG: GNAT family N-acetyltransferase [Anaerolineae bacterium]|nr:GNAT family N-acetyltransferase [Anaerolineae bacterium]